MKKGIQKPQNPPQIDDRTGAGTTPTPADAEAEIAALKAANAGLVQLIDAVSANLDSLRLAIAAAVKRQ